MAISIAPRKSTHKNLIVLRAGDQSLHKQWIAGPNRDFDLFISYYGKQQDFHTQDADGDLYEMRAGPKWSCIADLLAERPELLVQYDGFWFPDDDLAADTETINRMFALFRGFGLSLAQPALTKQSYYSWDTLLQKPGNILRYVGFVEVMAPLFTRTSLAGLIESFGQSRSGWGLDCVWPHILRQQLGDISGTIGILDATPVTHTRPVGGNLYANNPELDPRRDQDRILKQYGIEETWIENRFALFGEIKSVAPSLLDGLRFSVRHWNARRRLKRRAKKAATGAAHSSLAGDA